MIGSPPMFWTLAVVLIVLAAAFVVLPLLRKRTAQAITQGRDDANLTLYREQLAELEADRTAGRLTQEQFDQARRELAVRLAADTAPSAGAIHGPANRMGWGLALGLALPASALGLYLALGNPDAIVKQAEAEDAKQAAQHAAEDIDKAIREQQEKLKANPNDAEGWTALGLALSGMERWPEAEQAFAKAFELKPDDVAVVSAYAEALAVNVGRDLTGRPMELVRKALEMNPRDQKALELAGINAFQQKEYGQAAYYWRQLYKQLPEDSPYAQDIQAAMREAKGLSEEAAFGAPLDQRPPQDATHADAPLNITGTVELAPGLQEKIAPTDAVFLSARAVSGGAPLATLRATADKLPIPFTLDDSLAMLPDNAISKHETVTIMARISKTGSAEPTTGDLEGRIEAVNVGSQGVKLVIDAVRP